MRLKETTKKSAPTAKTSAGYHHNHKTVPLSGDLLSTLHISPPLHHHQLQLQLQHQQRCSSVGSTSSSGTCETDRSGSCSSALSPAAGGGGLMPGLGATSEGLAPPGAVPGGGGGGVGVGVGGATMVPVPGPNDEASAAAALAANIAESFTFLQQHAAHHFR